MKPASFLRAETPEGLKEVIRRAVILRFLGVSTDHLVESIAYGAAHQGMSEEALDELLITVREETRGAA